MASPARTRTRRCWSRAPGAVTLDVTSNVNRIESSLEPEPSHAFVYRSNAYERISPWETTRFLVRAAGACLLAVVIWPIGPRVVRRAVRRQSEYLYPTPDGVIRATNILGGKSAAVCVGHCGYS